MRYLVTSGSQVLAVVGFGASAWKAAPRDRFAGTCYRAANWTQVGHPRSRQLDVHKTCALPTKDIWLYPLRRDFRRRICAPINPPPHR